MADDEPILGPTGRFPDGKISDDDDGEVTVAISRDPRDGLIHVDFGYPISWLALHPAQAVALAAMLLKHARKQP